MTGGVQNGVPRRLWAILVAIAALTLLAEFFVHHHAAFGIDGSYAFYGWYTVGVGVIGVMLARLLAMLLGRKEDDDHG